MPKQLQIEGTEGPKIPEIEEAAEAYTGLRDKWQALGEKLTTAKVALTQTVLDHEKELSKDGDGNRVYRFDDMLVILKPGKPGVKVKAVHEDDDDEDDD